MIIKYLGPSESVNVEPYGSHAKDKIEEYPDDFGKELLATSKKQKFEIYGDASDAAEAEAKAKAEAEAKAKTEAEAKAKVEAEAKAEVEAEAKTEEELLAAAKAALDAGDVTGEGKPEVKAIEKRLGRDITAADRDSAWEKIQAEGE